MEWGGKEAVLFGGFCLHLIMGTIYTWGSLTPYVTSYLRQYNTHLTYDDTIIVYACQIGGQSCLMFFGGWLEQKVGPRLCALVGCAFLVASPLITSQVTSLWAMTMTYGIGFGIGVGLTYMAPVTCGYKWDPSRKGLISGIILSGFGAAALIFNQVQAFIVNPHNLKPEIEYAGKRYFAPGPVTEAVPGMFIKLSIIYGVMALLGVSLLRNPIYEKIQDHERQQHHEEEEGGRRQPNGRSTTSSSAEAAAASNGLITETSPLRRPLRDHLEADGDGLEDHQGEGEEEEGRELTPVELLCLPQAWHVSASLMLGALGGLVTLATYKSFGIVTFNDDHFMSMMVGSAASISNALGRVVWGFASDKLGPYRTLYTLSLILSFFFFTWILTIDPWNNKWSFAFWTAAITFCHGGNFAVYPALTAQLFGKDHSGSNFGVLFLGYGVCSLAGLAVLPRLSIRLAPLNYVLGLIAFSSALSVFLLERCYTSTTAGRRSDRSKQASRSINSITQKVVS